jgi:hypothetical protein
MNRNTLYRISATALSLLFFHFFPALAATAYMSWHGFYSYDFFAHGSSGISTFYWWSEILVIVAAIYLAGFFFFLGKFFIDRKKFNTSDLIVGGISLIVNAVFGLTIFLSSWKRVDEFNKWVLVGTYVIAIWAMIHISILFFAKGKPALISILFGIFILMSISVASPGSLAFPYSLTLQYFGNGGEILAQIKTAHGAANGRLILATPENYYIQKGNELILVKRSDVLFAEIKNMSGFGHNNKL